MATAGLGLNTSCFNSPSPTDKATNPDLREADLEAILEIVEEIKGKSIT